MGLGPGFSSPLCGTSNQLTAHVPNASLLELFACQRSAARKMAVLMSVSNDNVHGGDSPLSLVVPRTQGGLTGKFTHRYLLLWPSMAHVRSMLCLLFFDFCVVVNMSLLKTGLREFLPIPLCVFLGREHRRGCTTTSSWCRYKKLPNYGVSWSPGRSCAHPRFTSCSKTTWAS
jgi:hypothetical protein